MKRSCFISVLVLIFCFISNQLFAQRDLSKVEIKIIPVEKNIYMLQGAGGNIGICIGKDGILLVDTQFAELSDKIKDALKKISDGEIKYILNTHWHRDHTAGNVSFGTKALIISHYNVRKRLSTEQRIFSRIINPLPTEGLPRLTFYTSITLYFNDEEVRVVHFAKAHTDGDSVVFFTKSNVLHMGDLFFSGRFPFVDLESGGNVLNLTKTIESILQRIPSTTKIIPGHGPLSTREDLKAYHHMLIQTTEIVREKIEKGKSLEEIKAEGLPDVWKSWSSGFINSERWIEIIYTSLMKK
ncbi:MBL fold metallo-hydrolase [Candidatus Aminicenantes bacterium AC-335-K20]|jgi:glyoxylase-like metal-dependent hydrolase (beta-lactamase superfamily II)|nr:MBL fold metallo-hydrolase [SCandidatus Aminicenantes bacterium Aminicenantia_JdfR_composite]MCP2597024.1 MBL fold metallo-hydrolase [Candidatus Aminicenantes bacterium AC-335-G13]MCP2619080.1 MBL fold metallo-hydrolase [Candidatus Aminicenantes bacterium AC-335-A11]MCP2619363.1 MBL fold metallo-hydrolase [Candidatus Aminicenantes bacterium AC-335-K20]